MNHRRGRVAWLGPLSLLFALVLNDPVQQLCVSVPLPPPVAARRLHRGSPHQRVVDVPLPTPTPSKEK